MAAVNGPGPSASASHGSSASASHGSSASASRRVLSGVGTCLLPVLVALYVGATTFPGGTLMPWRPVMVDLDVYRQAGSVVLAGADFYDLPGPLQFLYPPIAALLAVPLALMPAWLVQVGWTVASALLMVAVMHRYGLSGWPLGFASAGAIWAVVPVSQTLAFGQLGIVLVALVVLDLAPGPSVLGGRRRLPEGVLTGVAAALKLTPMIFVLYLLAARRWRPALVATLTAAGATVAAAVVLPAASLDFWGRLARGDTGLGHSLIYYTNQSVLANSVRIFDLSPTGTLLGLAGSAVVVGLGVWAATTWHRQGEVRFAVCVCGIAGLLASPVSWLHHFVWVVPLGLALVDLGRRAVLPTWLQVLGWLFVGWVLVSPYRRLPNGADLELQWSWWQHGLAATTAVLGVAWVVGCLAVARGPAPSRPGQTAGRRSAARKLTRNV